MENLSAALYLTNILLFALIVLLFRITRTLRQIHQIKRNSDTALDFASSADSDRLEMKKLFEFLVEEQVKSRDALNSIKTLEEAILDRLPGYRGA